MKWLGQHIYDQVSRFRNGVFIENSDLTIYKPINDDPAIINLGSSATERLEIKALVATGTQEVNAAHFTTYTASTTGNRGRFVFYVDETSVLQIMDAGLNLAENKALQINNTNIITDSSGTATLRNIDALDSTTIATFNSALTAGDITSVSLVSDSGRVDKLTGEATFSIAGGTGINTSVSGSTLTATVVPAEIDHDSLENFSADEHFTQTNITRVGTIGTGVWQGTAINATYLDGQSGTNTGDETLASINALDITEVGTISSGVWQGTAITKDYIAADQRNITGVGTIAIGEWRGTPVANAYLDADTAHLTTDQTFTGVKTFNEAINKKALHFLYTTNKFTLDTSGELYFSLSDADRDVGTGSEDQVGVMAIVPLTGILKQVIINSSSTLSGRSFEFRLYRVPSGADADSGGEIKIATVSASAGPAAQVNKVISFVTDPLDGTNDISYETGYNATTMFTAGDRILLSLQTNSDLAGNPKINSVLCFELDESTI